MGYTSQPGEVARGLPDGAFLGYPLIVMASRLAIRNISCYEPQGGQAHGPFRQTDMAVGAMEGRRVAIPARPNLRDDEIVDHPIGNKPTKPADTGAKPVSGLSSDPPTPIMK